jgi:TolB protein
MNYTNALSMKILFIMSVLVLLFPQTIIAETGLIEVTAPGNRLLKLAVDGPRNLDSHPNAEAASEIGDIISFDMNMSGVVAADAGRPASLPGLVPFVEPDFAPWMTAGYDLMVKSEFSIKGDALTVEFRLYDVVNRKLLTAKRYLGKVGDLRRFSHSFSDEILLALTGERGCFTTRIAFVSTQTGNKEIFIMDWDGHNLIQLTRNGSINMNPDFSPDGREILFTSYMNGNPDLYKRAIFSSVDVPVSRRKGLNITGVWSPDGSRIALTLSKDGDAEIYTVTKEGENPQRLTVYPSIEVSPAWSPDGGRIAFVSDRFGKPQIFVMDANGYNVRRLTTSGNYNVNPRWSPKGDRIAYAHMEGGGFQIYTISTDGSNDTQLTSIGSSENPAWSPDGRFIAFSSKRDGVQAIYVMRADGSGQTQISRNRGNGTQPAWSSR